jgi:hypothetical protein
MENNESIREGLLARLPDPANLPAYREQVAALTARNEKALRREKRFAGTLWFFMVGLTTASLMLGSRTGGAKAAWLASYACVFLLFAAVELLKHFINRARVEILKETRQVQLQVLELQNSLRK